MLPHMYKQAHLFSLATFLNYLQIIVSPCIISLVVSGSAIAQTPTPTTTPLPLPVVSTVGGRTSAIPVSISGDTQFARTCINSSTDEILFKLLRVVVPKNGGLFRKDEEAGAHFSVTLEGQVTRNNSTQNVPPFTYDSVSTVTVSDFPTGTQVFLPLDLNLISFLKLKSTATQTDSTKPVDTSIINSARVKMFLLKKKRNTGFGFAVKELVNFSKKFPLPVDPLTQTVLNEVTDLTNGLLSEDNNDANNIKTKAATADVTFNFSPDGTCSTAMNTTGPYTIIAQPQPKDINKPGYVDIGNLSRYCLALDTGTSNLVFGIKPATGTCTPTTNVLNEYVLFTLDKVSRTQLPTPPAGQERADVTLPQRSPNLPVNVNDPLRATRLTTSARTQAIAEASSISDSGIELSFPQKVEAVLQTYSWYTSLSEDFKGKLNEAARKVTNYTQGEQGIQTSASSIPPNNKDSLLAEDYVRLIQSCLAVKTNLRTCALPAPPQRLLKK